MGIKMAYKGKNAGHQFYSCIRFPKCRGTLDINLQTTKKVETVDSPDFIRKRNDGPDSRPLMSQDTKDKLLKLIRYYKECVQVESLSEIELNYTDENNTYFQCCSEREWLSSGKETHEIDITKEISTFGRTSKFYGRSKNYYYSYPVFVKKTIDKKTAKESYIVIPILIFPVSLEKDTNKITISRLDFFKPQVNSSILNMGGVSARSEQKRIFVEKILQQWAEEDSYERNFHNIISELKDEFGPDNYFDPKLADLNVGKVSLLISESGFYSIAVVFETQGSQYTFGLEEELAEIEKKLDSENTPCMPALESLIQRVKTPSQNNPKISSLLEITPLNDEQRDSIKSAFENNLSVVTGPPGTGKSQVVINIIANAVTQGQNVLFGSKNHQAVDVVLERIYDIQEQPMILKFGKNAKESIFAEQLLSSIDKSIAYDKNTLETTRKEYLTELNNIAKKETEVWGDIHKCYEARNRISNLELLISSIEDRLPTDLANILIHNIDCIHIDMNITNIKNLAEKIRLEKCGFGDFIFKLLGHSLEKRLNDEIYRFLEDEELADVVKKYFISKIEGGCRLIDLAQDIDDSKSLIGLYKKCLILRKDEYSSVRKVTELELVLSNLQSNKVDIGPKYIDILMCDKFKSLGHGIRNDVSDYVAIAKRIENDRVGGDLVDTLRKEKKRLFSSVSKVFPALSVSNLSVRHVAPLEAGIFDLVVIDEASQCDIASALPMLVRAKRAVIIGDEKQLVHVSNISKVDDQQIQAKHGLIDASEQRFLYSTQSLFDLAKSTITTSGVYTILKDHYRSRAEIIQFSNEAFYGNQLRVWTDYRQLKQPSKIDGIYWHDVKGAVVRPAGGSAHNMEEANKVVEVLEIIIEKSLAEKATIGIVTPFRDQVNKIRSLVLKKIPLEKLEGLDLKIDTAHGYQGDQRDIIIFSPVVSENMSDRTKGFLSHTQNLFNVAITRPRSELHVVGDREECANSNIEYLEKFVKYFSKKNKINPYKKGVYTELFDSKWEELFYSKLKERGITAEPQLGVHQYKLDLAIIINDTYVDVEIDGESYHREITGERCISDVKRDIRLNSMGWIVKRFWVHEVKYDIERCLDEVEILIRC
jgi:very-short-patch-repair endonuclease/ssDNA-binding Zn-finger/Zn-ribbon topoisomerase 1